MTEVTDINRTGQIPGRIAPLQNNAVAEALKRGNLTGPSFGTLLNEQLAKNNPLQFSKHAQERVDQRGIDLTDDLLKNLSDAVGKARAKGAKDVIIFDAKQAFIVNVPNNTVVTTITGNEMKDNVFTNIDSAVMI